MPELIAAEPSGRLVHPNRLLALSVFLAAILAVLCYLCTGQSLDLFIGSLFLAALITPPLAAIAGQSTGALLCSLAVSFTFACCWFPLLWNYAINLAQLLQCLIVLWTFLLVAALGVRLLMRLGCGRVPSSAIITVMTLAWFTTPLWLSAALAGSQLRWSVALHPLLAINGIVPQLGFWTEHQIAYGLTNVGQDVQYQLPRSPWPIIAVQAGSGLVLWGITEHVRRTRPPDRLVKSQ
jgi:hypothetical protein